MSVKELPEDLSLVARTLITRLGDLDYPAALLLKMPDGTWKTISNGSSLEGTLELLEEGTNQILEHITDGSFEWVEATVRPN